MKTVIIILALLIILLLVSGRGGAVRTPSGSCPPGYVPSPVNNTWAGWTYNCLPVGVDSSLVGIPSDTYVSRMETVYAPIIDDTGFARSRKMGTPANILEFPTKNLTGLFPQYK